MRIGKNRRVILPKQICQLLDLKDYKDVEVRVENGQVTLGVALPMLEELAGFLPPLPDEMDVEDIIRQGKLEHYLPSSG